MFEALMRLPKHQQGIIYMAAGAMMLLLLHGVFRTLISWFLGLAGIGLVIYGFILLDGPNRIARIFKGGRRQR